MAAEPPAPGVLEAIGEPGTYAALLSWDSVGLSDTGGPFAWPEAGGWSAEKLRELDKESTPALLIALQYQDKAVAAHFLLAEIWDEVQGRCKGEREDRSDGVVLWRNQCGVMEWEEVESSVSDSAVEIGVLWTERQVRPRYLAAAFRHWCGAVPEQYSEVCRDAV